MSSVATQKLLDGTLAELSDIETHEVSLVPLGANGLPLLAVKGIAGEYTTAKTEPTPEPVPANEAAKITLTPATKASWVSKLARIEAAFSAIKAAVVGAVHGDEDSEDVGVAMVKLGKVLAPSPAPVPAPAPDSDALAQLAQKLLAQPRVSADDTETAVLMQRAADRIAQQNAQISKLTRDLERTSSRTPAPAADPHVDDALPPVRKSAFPVHWKAGKACGLSDED
jgi:hypothetical protein